MKPVVWIVFLTLMVGTLAAQEPDLRGLWHRENGAVLEAAKDGLGQWRLTLVKVGPQGGAAGKQALGSTLITGLKWSGSQWTQGVLRLPGDKDKTFDCRLIPLSDDRVELVVSVFPLSKKEVLTR